MRIREANNRVPDYVFWSVLNAEGKDLKNTLVRKWQGLLGDRSLREEAYQSFLSDHAGFFFSDGIYRMVVLSKIRLGANWVTDFVNTCSQQSYGFSYELIEIESPHTPPFNRSGKPSERLSQAVQQIQNWKRWIDSNRSEAKRLFPSANFTLADSPNFTYTVYIGSRENTQKWQEQRNFHSKELGIKIRSFDSLTDRVRTRPIMDFWIGGDETGPKLLPSLRNQLMNPFFKAYNDSVWRQIISSTNFVLYHMVTTNADSLLRNREYNRLYKTFLGLWKSLPRRTKNLYRTRNRQLGEL
jgi:hypothetical protein